MANERLVIDNKAPNQQKPFIIGAAAEKRTFIVTGAQGNLGQNYLKALLKHAPHVHLYGLHRRPLTGGEVPGVTYRQVDLNQRGAVEKALKNIAFDPDAGITLIHTVGMFRYEPEGRPPAKYDQDGDGVDDDIYRSNVETTRNVLAALMHDRAAVKISVVAFSSIIKEHQFPHFSSYDKAKRIMETDVRELTEAHPSVSAIVFNIPTLDTEAEHQIRPHAENSDTWLMPAQLVDYSLPEVCSLGATHDRGFREIDVFTQDLNFDLQTFIDDHAARWQRETGTPSSLMHV
jgi:NAD(P)-dependent dehydrogenase (short-subunit alcohol dehydrogenase family)